MEKLDIFVNAKADIFNYFGVKNDYFIKPCAEYSWTIKVADDMYFLNYWKGDEKVRQCIIVKKDGSPQIFTKDGSTMIIVIECIKLAIVLDESLRI